ncbi:MAG: glycosyltransferase [Candidatus Omnitrophica bacterium]|nr:glycosyltransferase [Candidatus Omnitrophota bacterium]
MSEVLISVVMPTYNFGHLISRAIDSVIQQKYGGWELIIIDNFSSDNTEQVVSEYKDHRIRYLKFANNGVIAASRNKGIELACGKFVAFLDSDDLWYPSKLEKVILYFKAHPDCDFLCHDENLLYEDGHSKAIRYGPWKKYKELLYCGNSFSTSAVVAKKNILTLCDCFSTDLDEVGVEDYDLWLKISRVGRMEFLHEVLGAYYIHEGAFSSKVERLYSHLLNVLMRHYSEIESKSWLDSLRMRIRLAEILRQTARDLLKKGEKSAALPYSKKALLTNPFSFKAIYTFCSAIL